LSNEGSKVDDIQETDCSETMEEIDLTGETGESGSHTSESEYRDDLTVITNEVSSDEELIMK
jgi:hypothetical protein